MKRENPWHGLLFLHGHIADRELARSLAQDDPGPGADAAQQAGALLRSEASRTAQAACEAC